MSMQLSRPYSTLHRRSIAKVHRGFTLVELLVTITIVVVLAAIVFVMTGKIRTSAQQTSMVSAMRQIGQANIGYSSENNGAINVIRDANESGGAKWVSESFMGRMQPYLFADLDQGNQGNLAKRLNQAYGDLLGTSDIKTMAGTVFDGVPVTTDGSTIRTPFACNLNLKPGWKKAPQRMASHGDPASIIHLTYGRYYITPELAQKYTPLPQAGENRRCVYFFPNRQAAFCFLDGHVELLSAPVEQRLFGVRPPDQDP
jgi:prepilin-type N-terminal cleavage/methylation domain-containing protein/prepilin-type processing-associated H-X9-DG protein